MKKLLLSLFLACVSTSAMAEWTKVEELDGVVAFADIDKSSRDGNISSLWVLLNFKTPQPGHDNNILSEMWQEEYDCNDERRRVLSELAYDKHMGKGNVLFSSHDTKPSNWVSISPASIDEELWKVACK